MTERHFESDAELRGFVAEVADEYRADADEYGASEAATALYDDHDLCPSKSSSRNLGANTFWPSRR